MVEICIEALCRKVLTNENKFELKVRAKMVNKLN